jgi:hypothetical protein
LALPTETLFDATLLTDTHTVDSTQTQLFIDQNIVNGGRVL